MQFLKTKNFFYVKHLKTSAEELCLRFHFIFLFFYTLFNKIVLFKEIKQKKYSMHKKHIFPYNKNFVNPIEK